MVLSPLFDRIESTAISDIFHPMKTFIVIDVKFAKIVKNIEFP